MKDQKPTALPAENKEAAEVIGALLDLISGFFAFLIGKA